MDLNYHLIGLRIRHFRTERNMSQEELGDLVGTTNRHIINIENGNKGPSLTLLVAIANALNVTSDDLLLDNLKRYGTLSDKRIAMLKEIAERHTSTDNLSDDLTENIAQTY